MKHAVITPSRGLIHSRTVESIFNGIQSLPEYEWSFFTTHDKPIPEAQNDCMKRAVNWGAKVIVSIEEDNVIDISAFKALVQNDYPVAILQYNDRNGSPHGIIHKDESGDILWSGIGALKVKMEVFEAIGQPYFRTDVRYAIKKKPLGENTVITRFEEIDHKSPQQYGGLDVDFYTRARRKGYEVKQVIGHLAHHMKLVKLGDSYTNNGCHDIQTI